MSLTVDDLMMVLTTEQYNDLLIDMGLPPSDLEPGKLWFVDKNGVVPVECQ